MLDRALILTWLDALNFQVHQPADLLVSQQSDIFEKNYQINNMNYKISVDIGRNHIDYGHFITIGDETTSNLNNPENLVVLECIDRLLAKGYNPKDIQLEKKWTLGRTQKSGKADIIIHQENQALLIIECKTWGSEYDKEKQRMQNNGGQLFSYLQQERSVKYLALYASEFNQKLNKIIYENAIIRIEDDSKLVEAYQKDETIKLYQNANTVEELYQVWNENYSCYCHPNGIFEDDIQPYEIDLKPLKIKDLKPFSEVDGGFIFNQFAEILRHNTISDKENAFNRLISLFLCKIVDESKTDDQIAEFQWKEGIDTYEALQDRLQRLYHDGMQNYLKQEIVYYPDNFVDQAFIHHKEAVAKDQMRQMLKALKFYTNNEFAFQEVHNQDLFQKNAKILNEVIQLLQPYKIKYSQKQQFLGNLFELLLNSGVKQSEGQFFTPMMITRFIICCLPMLEFVQSSQKLPKIIDYACGSGHFLTEAIDEIQTIIHQLNIEEYQYSTDSWTAQHIFGIEKDYRLARVSKIACFLNGAGNATIIYGDGLEHHQELGEYETFDYLIANPPYSIKDFKQHLNLKNKTSYHLLDKLTLNSSEIEVLFIERIHHLLKPNGIAGIVLPASILSNDGVYFYAREIILKYFNIKAIVEFGKGTFFKTGTNTITLFLEKRSDFAETHYRYRANDLFKNASFDDIEYQDGQILQDYCQLIGIKTEDYLNFIKRNHTESLSNSEWRLNYLNAFNDLTDIKNLKKSWAFKEKSTEDQQKELDFKFYDFVLNKEYDKFYYFCLVRTQSVLVVKSGEGDIEKSFLGYEWSNRRGSEGMKTIGDSKLFDDHDAYNPQKASSYVRKILTQQPLDSIDEILQDHVFQYDLVDMMDFSKISLDNSINLNIEKQTKINYSYPLIRLNEFIQFLGKSKRRASDGQENGKYPFFTSSQTQSKFIDIADYQTESIIIGTGGNANIHFATEFSTSADVFIIQSINDQLLNKYIYYFFRLNLQYLELGFKGVGLKHISKEYVQNLNLPLPPIDIQQQIIDSIEIIEHNVNQGKLQIDELNQNINQIIDDIYYKNYPQVELKSVAEIKNGGTPKTNIREYWDNGSIKWATLVDTKQKYLFDTQRKITESGLKNSSAVLLPIHTVIYSSRATIGEITIAKTEVCTNQGYKNFICNESKIHYEYLYYILKKETPNLERLANGMTYPELSKSEIEHFKIVLPPINIQQQIVDKILQLESKINELQHNMNQADQQKKEILEKFLLN